MQTGVAHVGVLVVELVDVAAQQVVDHLEELGGASGVLEEQEDEVVVVREFLELEQLGTVEMALEHGYLPGVKVLLVGDLVHYLDQVHNQLDIPIRSGVVKQSVVAVVPLEVALRLF